MKLILDTFRERFYRFKPNVIGYDRDKSVAAILIKQSRGSDFALSEAALLYVIEGERDGRIKAGYVVLLDPVGSQVIAEAKVADIYNACSKMRRQDGKFGAYWWINKDFQDAMLIAENAPF